MLKKYPFLKIYSLLIICALSLQYGVAQSVSEFDSVPVSINGTSLLFPWAGGLNNPQYSTIDYNNDGIQDLFVFDESNQRVMTFINQGIHDSVSYIYNPSYEPDFPNMYQWAILADYNNDGHPDIFTFNSDFIRVYRNDYKKYGTLKFTKVTDTIYELQGTTPTALLININAFPCFTDIDGDGALDIMYYTYYVYLYLNKSIKKYGNPDSLDFEYSTQCWGGFSSQTTSRNTVKLSACTPRIGGEPSNMWSDYSTDRINPPPVYPQHNGQSILALDLNGDGYPDCILGDVIENSLDGLINGGGSDTAALMVSQDSTYPKYDVPCNLYTLQVPFYLDVNNDSLKDLLVSPYAANVSNDYQSTWYYKNTGTKTIPNFHYIKKTFLQDQMIDIGEGAYPAFLDYNCDGLMDLVVGNYGSYDPIAPTGFRPDLLLFQNIGTATKPQFKLIDTNFANLDSLTFHTKELQTNNICPTFGDLDSDGAVDMLIGAENDSVYYFHNTAKAGNPVHFVLTPAPFLDSINYTLNNDFAIYTAPQLIDVNGDGKLDLIIGSLHGKLYYFENTGTRANPHFTYRSSNFGGVNVIKKGFFTGYSVPFMYTYQGHHRMLVGTLNGALYMYDNIDGNLSGTFNLVDTLFSAAEGGTGVWKGTRSAAALYDLHSDSALDLIAGNYGGGLTYFKGAPPLGIPVASMQKWDMTLYPNPTDKSITIYLPRTEVYSADHINIEIYDLAGRKLFTESTSTFMEFQINTSTFADGMYLCKTVAYGNGTKLAECTSKFIVRH